MRYNVSYTNYIVVEVSEVENAIKHMPNALNIVIDKSIVALLAMCITGFFVHGFLPNSLLSVVLVPIIKDKYGKIYSKDND